MLSLFLNSDEIVQRLLAKRTRTTERQMLQFISIKQLESNKEQESEKERERKKEMIERRIM